MTGCILATSESIRRELVEVLKLDLVGPDNQHAFAHELLPEPPSRWYLTGFLVPKTAPIEQRSDETSAEEIDTGGDAEGLDDASPPDRGPARRSLLPSSMGLSVLVAPGVDALDATVSWGDYVWEGGEREPNEAPTSGDGAGSDNGVAVSELEGSVAAAKLMRGYRRIPQEETVNILLPQLGDKPKESGIPNGRGLTIIVTVRAVTAMTHLPTGTKSVSVFLVNNRNADKERAYLSFAFQTELKITSPLPFVPRVDPRGALANGLSDEWDEQVADLHHRDVFEYAVGHGVSATAELEAGGGCSQVRTIWIPSAEVERVEPSQIPGVQLGMEELGALADAADASAKLMPLVRQYRQWVSAQSGKLAGLGPKREKAARDLLLYAEHAARRIEAGIAVLADRDVLEAFRVVNRAMAAAARHREAIQHQTDPGKVDPPTWRPFQLAFLLMTLRGIVESTHDDREMVDLLFFPTGGGKTEAYLAVSYTHLTLPTI